MKMAKMWDTRTPRESMFKHILQHIPVKKSIYKHTEESFSIFAVLQIDNKPLKSILCDSETDEVKYIK